MTPLVDTICEDPRWEGLGLPALAEAAARAALLDRGMEPEGFEIALLGGSDARVATLNAEFRGTPTPTNVLSWPSEERGAEEDGALPDRPRKGDPTRPEELGDIAIAFDTCAREAEASGRAMGDHVTHLIVHGVLHLLGYDHIREKDGDLMEGAEVRILARLGLSDPYEGDGR